jgi:dTMP kinase
LIAQIVQLATGGLKPDLTLLFDVSIEDATARTTRRKFAARDARDRLDVEDAEFHTRVRDAYLRIAAAEPTRVKVIDTTGPVDRTQQRVQEVIVAFLKARGQLKRD